MGPHSLRDYFGEVLNPIVEELKIPKDYESETEIVADSFSDFLVSSFLRWLTNYPVITPQDYLEQLICVGSVLSVRLSEMFFEFSSK
jgi:hypothetical protein